VDLLLNFIEQPQKKRKRNKKRRKSSHGLAFGTHAPHPTKWYEPLSMLRSLSTEQARPTGPGVVPTGTTDGGSYFSTEIKMRPLLSRVEMTSYQILRVTNKVSANLKMQSKRQERKQGINYRIH
jgi:hypothetical protein